MIRIGRLYQSFVYAFRGLFKVLREEQNLRLESLIGFLSLLIGWYFEIENWEWSVLILVMSLVILTEVINSAVERITDVLKPRLDNYVKEIKDITAAAVMLASMTAVIIGLIIFLPYFSELF